MAVHGEVDPHSARILRALLLDVVEGQGNLSVTLDMSDVTFIDSAGLTVLLELHGRAVERGGRFVLHNARPSTARMFEITGLNQILRLA